jgi:hypothetical protein
LEQPFGMSLFRNNPVISDRATGRLQTFSLSEQSIVGSTPPPCGKPMELTADANGLWKSDRGDRRLLHFRQEKNKVAHGNGSCSEFTLAFRRGRSLIKD